MQQNDQRPLAELQEARFAAVFRSSPIGICITTLKEGTFLDANPAFLKTENLTLEEILGRTSLELGYWRDPDERQKMVQHLLETGAPINCEMSHRLKNGTVHHSLRSLELITLGGRDCIVTMLTDITGRKVAEQTLVASEERFRALIEHSYDAISLVDANGILLYGSPSATAISGQSLEEYLGKSAFERIHPDDVPTVHKMFARLLTTPGQAQQAQFRLRHKDESWIWLEATATNLLDHSAVQAIVINYRDITDRQRAEDAMRESEGRLRLLLKAGDIGLWDWNLLTNEAFLSPEWKRQLGYADHEVANHYLEWESRLHPEDRERALAAVNGFREGRRKDFNIEFRLRHKDGSWRWIMSRADVIHDPEGRPIRMLGCHIDITDRKQTDELLAEHRRQLTALLRHLPGMVYRCANDEKWTMTFVSEGAEQLTGFRADELLHNRVTSFGDLVALEDREWLWANCQHSLAAHVPCSNEYRIRHRDGSVRWVWDRASGYYDENGALEYVEGYVADVTERKRAEEELRKSERKFSTVFRNSPVAIGLTSLLDGRILDCNEAYCQLLGFQRGELIGHSTLELNVVHPHDRAGHVEILKKNGRLLGQETQYRTKSGCIRDVLVSAERLDLGDEPLVLAISQDITERKQVELVLRASEANLVAAQELAKMGSWELDPQTLTGWWSPGMFRLFDRDMALGVPSFAEFFEMVHPDDREELSDLPARLATSTGGELRFRFGDGPFRYFYYTSQHLRDAQGQTVRLAGVLQDVTDRKQGELALRESQAMLELVLDSIPQGVFWKDRDSVYRGANRVSRRAMGVEDPQEVVGRTDFDVPNFQKEQAESFVQKDREIMQSDQPQFGIVETMTLPDGATIWLETNKLPMHDDAGNVTGILGTWEDITERKRANEELTASRERLETLSRQLIGAQEAERRHLSRELHDEIGQALTSIKLNLKTMQQRTHEAALGPLVDETISVVEQTLQQVRNLALDLRPSMLDELGLVAALRWCFDRQAQRAGFAPQFFAEALDCAAAREIETACYRVAQESLTNIARHANARHVRVELRQHGTLLELLVQDDGIGFDVAAARDRASNGASLGLLGMQERVLLIGGQLEIESVPAGGTLVRAKFPIKDTRTHQWPEMMRPD